MNEPGEKKGTTRKGGAAKKRAKKKPPAKKAARKKPPAKKTARKKPPAKKTARKKPPAMKTARKKPPAKKAAGKKPPAMKAARKKSPAKKTAKKTSRGGNGSLEVLVRDPAGEALPGVEVVIEAPIAAEEQEQPAEPMPSFEISPHYQKTRSKRFHLVTDERGRAAKAALPPGIYTVTAGSTPDSSRSRRVALRPGEKKLVEFDSHPRPAPPQIAATQLDEPARPPARSIEPARSIAYRKHLPTPPRPPRVATRIGYGSSRRTAPVLPTPPKDLPRSDERTEAGGQPAETPPESAPATPPTAPTAPRTTGRIRVTVQDPEGSPLEGAQVRVRSETSGLERSDTTDGQGRVTVSELPPGAYRVTAEEEGFEASYPYEVLLRYPGREQVTIKLQFPDDIEEMITFTTLGAEAPLRRGLALSGGAPNATCMAGAMLYIHEQDMNFEVVTASGAGALVALLHFVPRGGDTRASLEASRDLGIEDLIYRYLPINYKVFKPGGELAAAYRHLTQPLVERSHGLIDRWFDNTKGLRERWEPWLSRQRRAIQALSGVKRLDGRCLTHDWLDLVHSALTPVQPSAFSKGLCAHPPFVSKFVDFDAVKELPFEFYLNAYNVTRKECEVFGKEVIDEEHFNASLAYPFFYEPYRLPNGDVYMEGAMVDPINYQAIEESQTDVSKILIFDVVGDRGLIHNPPTLIDAFAQSIMVPLIEAARNDTELIENDLRRKWILDRLTAILEDLEAEGEDTDMETLAENLQAIRAEVEPSLRRATRDQKRKWALEQLDRVYRKRDNLGDTEELVAQIEKFKAVLDPEARRSDEAEYKRTLLQLPIRMTVEQSEHALDWTSSNLEAQFELGYRSAKEYFESNPEIRELFQWPLWEP